MKPGSSGRAQNNERSSPSRSKASSDARLRLISNALGERLVPLVAAAGANVTIDDLCAESRKQAPVAAARQLGMYLAHTLFSSSFSRTGRVFGRDRTTVRHACQSLEARREDQAVHRMLTHLEPAMTGWSETFAEQAIRSESAS